MNCQRQGIQELQWAARSPVLWKLLSVVRHKRDKTRAVLQSEAHIGSNRVAYYQVTGKRENGEEQDTGAHAKPPVFIVAGD
jgi:hypothetical protein